MINNELKTTYLICLTILITQLPTTLAQDTVQIKVLESQIGTVIQINNDVLFEENKLEIKPTGYNTLDKIADIIKKSNKSCIVESNTIKNSYKNTLTASDWELTIIRSDKIINYLINYHGIDPQKLYSNGFGEKLPEQNLYNRTDFLLKN